MIPTFDIGDRPTLRSAFEVDEVPTDPTTVTLWVRTPRGSQTKYTGSQLAKVSTGVYTYDLPLTEAGEWTYRWEGTGACPTAEEKTFKVRLSKFIK